MLVEMYVVTELTMGVTTSGSMSVSMALALALATSLVMAASNAVAMSVVTCLSFGYGWVCSIGGRGLEIPRTREGGEIGFQC